jgi:hypothetical protein
MLETSSAQIEARAVSNNRYIRVRNLFDESKFLDLRKGVRTQIRPLRNSIWVSGASAKNQLADSLM